MQSGIKKSPSFAEIRPDTMPVTNRSIDEKIWEALEKPSSLDKFDIKSLCHATDSAKVFFNLAIALKG